MDPAILKNICTKAARRALSLAPDSREKSVNGRTDIASQYHGGRRFEGNDLAVSHGQGYRHGRTGRVYNDCKNRSGAHKDDSGEKTHIG